MKATSIPKMARSAVVSDMARRSEGEVGAEGDLEGAIKVRVRGLEALRALAVVRGTEVEQEAEPDRRLLVHLIGDAAARLEHRYGGTVVAAAALVQHLEPEQRRHLDEERL